ncbi:MAG: LysR family transcriptional regulator [Candidatus Limivivens sp.]|nr:LysR family transcriptional regulator [Candidatus Limivivens sp.]
MTLQQLRYAITVADCSSINEAAKILFISQPSLSGAIKELENETGVEIFRRNNRGITVTPEGEEFLGYARQVVEQYRLIESKYISKQNVKKKFSVSMQHYTFAVKAFVELVKQFGMDEYEFAVHETMTYEVIDNVRTFKSEIGILYLNDFNRNVLTKLFREYDLEFHELLECRIYVYLWKGNPLAQKKEITMEELADYPCLSFEQGNNNSFYFAEEVLSTYEYKQIIKANDRATFLNLMVGLNGYTLCSGILCEELNGSEYCAIPLKSDEVMTIGYLTRKGTALSPLGKKYVEEIGKYKERVL